MAICGPKAKFDIFGTDGTTVVAQITKEWAGVIREMMTDADTFGLTVPANMDMNWKAVLLALTFVVDFQFYEKTQDSRLNRRF